MFDLNEFKMLAGIGEPLLEYSGNGVLIAFFIPKELAKKLALTTEDAEPAEDLHVSLVYLGTTDTLNKDTIKTAIEITEKLAKQFNPFEGKIGGYGRFSNAETSGKDVLYLSVNVPGLENFQILLLEKLTEVGISVKQKNAFTPHITLSYIAKDKKIPFHRIKALPVVFSTISVTVGSGNRGRYNFPLEGRK